MSLGEEAETYPNEGKGYYGFAVAPL